MDPTLPYDFQSLWCSKHRDGLHYLANWQLEELFAELDESLEEHASEEERRLLEGQKRMLLPALMQIEMEVARNRGVPGRPLADYLRVLPQYEEQLRKIFAERESDRVNASERDTEDVPAPGALQQWKSGNWVDCYRLVEILGSGGFGEVWQAQGFDGGLVAIKAMNLVTADKQPHQTASLEARAEILAGEARILRELTGKKLRVPKYVGYGDHHGRSYLVMEYIEGRDLKSARRKPGNWQWPRCAEIVLSLLETVERLTSLSYYHYDIKPHNVILDPKDQAWVIDLGSAQSWEQMCAGLSDPTLPTTYAYAPPELLTGRDKQFSAQTGIYFVGGVLYYLLTGKHPKPETREARQQFDAHKLTPQAPGELHLGLPEWLDALCLRMLAHNKEDRPLNATAVIEELRRELSVPPPTPAPLLDTGVARKAPPATSTWRRIAGLTALVVAVGGTTLGALSILGGPDDKPIRDEQGISQEVHSIRGTTDGIVYPPQLDPNGHGWTYSNTFLASRKIWTIPHHSKPFTLRVDLSLSGDFNATGLAFNFQEEQQAGSDRAITSFDLLCFSPKLEAAARGDHRQWKFRYGRFAVTNPSDPKPGALQSQEGTLRQDDEPIASADFYLDNRPDNLRLELTFERNQLVSMNVNGVAMTVPSHEPLPKWEGKIELLIDSLDTDNPGKVRVGPVDVHQIP